MNPFHILDAVQQDYLTYVRTFQRFQNPQIHDWVLERHAPLEAALRASFSSLCARRLAGETGRCGHLASRHVAHLPT